MLALAFRAVTNFEQSLLYATWAGVIVALAGVFTAFRAARKSAAGTERALDHAKKMSEHELRAYVFLNETTVEAEPRVGGAREATGWVTYDYINSGKTPAKRVMAAARAIWRPRGASIDEGAVGIFRPVGPLGPGDKLNDKLQIEGAPKPDEIRAMIERSGCEVHLIGCIRYADEWSEERETSFHYYIGADAGWDEEMTAATTGNDYK